MIKKMNKKILIAGFMATTLTPKALLHSERRVAFDIGSLTTKMIVADVDTRNNVIEKILLKDVREVGYKHDLERPQTDGNVSPAMLQKGIEALRQLKSEAEALTPKPTAYAAVATAALRAAKNGAAVSHAINNELHIPLTIIPQEKEAFLGFNGALAKTGKDRKHTVVWDAGGGSMQMIMLDSQGSLKTYGNELGFIAFTKEVIKNVQFSQSATPNPLSAEDAQKAIALGSHHATKVAPFIKDRISQPGVTVVGIGALYYATHGVPSEQAQFTLKDIESMLESKLDKTDDELKGVTHKAIPVIVSATSLCLIIGFMKELGIENIILTEVNMTDGLLVDSAFYQTKEALKTEL